MTSQNTAQESPEQFENEMLASATGTGVFAALMAAAAIALVTGTPANLPTLMAYSMSGLCAVAAATMGACSTAALSTVTSLRLRREKRSGLR